MQYYKFALYSALLSLLLNGCATFSNDGGLADVKALTAPHLKQEVVWPKNEGAKTIVAERVSELLQEPLNADSAVQVALLNNSGLQASLYALGVAEADVVQAGRLPNPKFSMLYARHQGEYKIEQALTFNIFSLLAMPKVLEIERSHFEKTKQAVAIEVLSLAYETRAAYFNAVAANELVRYSVQVKESAEASAVLAQRMVAAGNWNTLEQAREQGFYADALLEYTSAKLAQNRAHASLARLLGVSAEQLKLEKRLPDIPKTASELQPLDKTAFEQRLDLQAIRLETAALAKQLGLTKTSRFINVLEIGPARVLEGRRGDAYKKGVDFAFELPLFDWGDAKVARAEAIYMQSVHRAAQTAVNAQSEISEAYSHYLATYEMAKYYRDDIVPLRQKILAENQLRYNGMLVSPFELFADARAQVASVKAYINSLNEFWLAETALNKAFIGKPTSLEGK